MKLKPCPFGCEGGIELMKQFESTTPYFVMCKQCKCRGPEKAESVWAADAWNTRRKAKK